MEKTICEKYCVVWNDHKCKSCDFNKKEQM
jgi:hypothetical protein